jgi:hypothetical protein
MTTKCKQASAKGSSTIRDREQGQRCTHPVGNRLPASSNGGNSKLFSTPSILLRLSCSAFLPCPRAVLICPKIELSKSGKYLGGIKLKMILGVEG